MTFTKQLEIDQRAQRSIEFVDLYRSGWNMQEIGDVYALSRERVRQLLAKAGMRDAKGGLAVRREMSENAKKSKRQQLADARSFRRYGCSASQLRQYNCGLPQNANGSMTAAYNSQKSNAKMRMVEWRMTLPEWCEIWKKSGFLEHRGRGAGKYVMARLGDIGPYSPENVYITTNAQNITDGYEFRRQRHYKRPHTAWFRIGASGKRGVRWDKNAKKWRAHIRVDGKQVHLGLFRDIDEAAAARAAAEEKINAALAG